VAHPVSNLPSLDGQCTALLRMIEQGRMADGLVLARDLTERFPGHGFGWKFLGALLWGEGRTEDALAAMQTSVGLLPHDAEAHKNLGTAMVQLKRFDAASPHLRRATEIDPSLAAPHYQLAMIDLHAERFVAAQANLRSGLTVRGTESTSDDVVAHSGLLVLMSQDPTVDADALFAEHCRFGEYVEAPLRASWPRHVNRKTPSAV
jgi:protein O-GlcNAc transferase